MRWQVACLIFVMATLEHIVEACKLDPHTTIQKAYMSIGKDSRGYRCCIYLVVDTGIV